MPNFGFYAAGADVPALLEFVFGPMECRVLEAYSHPDQPLVRYRTPADTMAAYRHDSPWLLHVVLWRPDWGPEPVVRRIDLRPGAIPGHSFRHTVEGWGLLNLIFGEVRDGRLPQSRLSANTEARARRWADTYGARLGPVEVWRWPLIAEAMRQFKDHVTRRLAVDRYRGRPVLPAAAALGQGGLTFAEL